MTSKTEVPQTLVGPLLQSFFMEHLCNHKRLSPQTVKSYRIHSGCCSSTFRLKWPRSPRLCRSPI